MANVEFFHEVMANVTAENLDMNSWAAKRSPARPEPVASCGTTMCLAGHAVNTAGIGIAWFADGWEDVYNEATGEWEEIVTAWSADETVDGDNIEDKATELLGMEEYAAHNLFHDTYIGSDVNALWEAITNHTDGEVTKPVAV